MEYVASSDVETLEFSRALAHQRRVAFVDDTLVHHEVSLPVSPVPMYSFAVQQTTLSCGPASEEGSFCLSDDAIRRTAMLLSSESPDSHDDVTRSRAAVRACWGGVPGTRLVGSAGYPVACLSRHKSSSGSCEWRCHPGLSASKAHGNEGDGLLETTVIRRTAEQTGAGGAAPSMLYFSRKSPSLEQEPAPESSRKKSASMLEVEASHQPHVDESSSAVLEVEIPARKIHLEATCWPCPLGRFAVDDAYLLHKAKTVTVKKVKYNVVLERRRGTCCHLIFLRTTLDHDMISCSSYWKFLSSE